MMKNLIICFLLIGGCSLAFSQKEDIYERPVQTEPSHNFDVLHYRIDLTFEGENRAFEGITTVTLRALTDEFTGFDLHAETYQVREVTTNDQKTLAFKHEDGNLSIQLAEAIG